MLDWHILANRDPRPDLTDDSMLWVALLRASYKADPDPEALCGTLYTLRCCGAGLEVRNGHLVLIPGEMARDEYAADREKWLVPHKGELVRLLDGVEAKTQVLVKMEVV